MPKHVTFFNSKSTKRNIDSEIKKQYISTHTYNKETKAEKDDVNLSEKYLKNNHVLHEKKGQTCLTQKIYLEMKNRIFSRQMKDKL